MSFFTELKRRKVIRASIAYVIGAWLLLQLTEVLSELLTLPANIGPIVVTIVAIGFPIVVVLTWMFELTSDGLKRDKDVADGERSSGKFINVTVIGLLVIALAYFVWESRFSGPGSQTNPATGVINSATGQLIETPSVGRSIAVLPFESFSEDKANEYFADGLSDTLLHKLAQISDLKVIARNSSFQFKGSNKDVREIGEILGVETILEGSVQKSGDRVRIIAQLIRTNDGSHIWSQTFDGSTDDIFTLQDDVATGIVDQFQLSLSAAEKAALLRNGTSNPEAYDLVIRALNRDRRVDELTDIRAEEDEKTNLLLQAVELDPEYALAWAYLSRSYNDLAFATDSSANYDRLVAESQRAAEEAMRLDPTLADAHNAMGWVAHRKRDQHEAERWFRKALELSPNSLGAMSGLALQLGSANPEEVLNLLDRSIELDPTSSIVHRQKHFAYMALNRPEDAIEELKIAIEMDPKEGMYYNDLVDLLEREGRPDEGAVYASRLLEMSPDSSGGQMSLAEAWMAVGDYERSGQWLALLLRSRLDSDVGKRLEVERLVADEQYQAALDLLDTISVTDRSAIEILFRRIPTCMGLKSAECSRQLTGQMRMQIDQTKTQRTVNPVFDYYLGLAELLTAEMENPSRDLSREATKLLESPAAFGLTFFGNLHFARAGLTARTGEPQQALEYLDASLGERGQNIYNRDVFGMPAETSLLLHPLRDHPGFQDWMTRYLDHRALMQARMEELEGRGEIISIAKAERQVSP